MTDVRMTDAAARIVTTRFEELSAEFTNTVPSLVAVSAQLNLAAGEFGSDLGPGTGAFEISWREAFRVCGTTAAIIAGNTNQMSVDLSRLDRDASTEIHF
ncbi:MAG: hypothetical protein ABI776_05470 [Nocardioidaceae bacterium]